MIYFVKNNDYIKIGYSEKPKHRITQMRVSNPTELECLLLIDGGYDKESQLHRQFSESRISGEWFQMGDGIAKFINDNLSADRRYEYGLLEAEFSGNEQLKRLRLTQKLTLSTVAEKLGITAPSLMETEQRESNKSITLKSLEKVAGALGYKLEYRFVETDRV